MKIIHAGVVSERESWTGEVICVHCKAILEIEARDIAFQGIPRNNFEKNIELVLKECTIKCLCCGRKSDISEQLSEEAKNLLNPYEA